jgi:NADPH-dependent 2,4-dienoyl-CoA reductase/sulfur reductase-like enzyme
MTDGVDAEPEQAELAVVGAGPAGLAAAAEASRAGVRVVVLDEQGDPGGQYMRLRHSSTISPPGKIPRRAGVLRKQLLRELVPGRVEIRTRTMVWGAFDEHLLGLYGQAGATLLRYQALVVSAGAYDRPFAFPGWTLPGVYTAGAAQILAKVHGVAPGRRVLLAGSGPFLLPVAEELVHVGARVVAVLEATHPARWWPLVQRTWQYPDRTGELLHYLRALRRAHVPVRFGRVVSAVRGEGRVEEATIVRVDAQWAPVAGGEETMLVDAVCVGFGFLPSTELTRQLGLEHRFDPLRGGWVPVCDGDMRTSAPDVFVAGETAGIGGAQVAVESGRLAGIAAARYLGYITPETAEERAAVIRRRYRRARVFADTILQTFAPRSGLYALVTDDTLVCRCEEITAGQVRRIARRWPHTLASIKGALRVGMGMCQGRICGRIIAGMIAHDTGQPEESLGMLSARPPLKPIPLAALAAMHYGGGGEDP